MRLKKLSKIFLFIGTCSFIYWPRVIDSGPIGLLRFETAYAVACVFGIIYLLLYEKQNHNVCPEKTGQDIVVLILLAVFLFSIIFATLWSLLFDNLDFTQKGAITIVKLILGNAILLLTINFARQSRRFINLCAIALCAGPVLMSVVLILPRQYVRFAFPEELRYYGLTANPGLISMLCAIAFSFVCAAGAYCAIQKYWTGLFLLGLCGMGLFAQIINTLMRTSFVACIVSGTAAIAMICLHFNFRIKLRYITPLMILIVISFVLLPDRLKHHFTNHVVSCITNPAAEPRYQIWKYYSSLLLRRPFGIGLNFEEKYYSEVVYWNAKGVWHFGPHSFLDLWMFGGVASTLSIAGLCLAVFQNAKRKLYCLDGTALCSFAGSVAAFISLMVNSLFHGSPITFAGFWLILGLCLL